MRSEPLRRPSSYGFLILVLFLVLGSSVAPAQVDPVEVPPHAHLSRFGRGPGLPAAGREVRLGRKVASSGWAPARHWTSQALVTGPFVETVRSKVLQPSR